MKKRQLRGICKMAEQSGAAAITLHGRTRSQQYSGTADWDMIREVKQAVCIPVFANGDVAEPRTRSAFSRTLARTA